MTLLEFLLRQLLISLLFGRFLLFWNLVNFPFKKCIHWYLNEQIIRSEKEKIVDNVEIEHERSLLLKYFLSTFFISIVIIIKQLCASVVHLIYRFHTNSTSNLKWRLLIDPQRSFKRSALFSWWDYLASTKEYKKVDPW